MTLNHSTTRTISGQSGPRRAEPGTPPTVRFPEPRPSPWVWFVLLWRALHESNCGLEARAPAELQPIGLKIEVDRARRKGVRR
jgi:hypothetical protein